MKKLLYILAFLPLFAQSQTETVMSHDQNYRIPVSAWNNDSVGQFHINVTDGDFETVTSYSYSITSGNSDGVFGITSSGYLYVDDSTNLSAGTYDLTIRIQETSTSRDQTFSAYVVCTPESDNIYIDFSWTGTESGTRTQPFNSLRDDIQLGAGYQQGKNYYIKRGEESSTNDRIYVSDNWIEAFNYICFAAYGKGAKPQLQGSGSQTTGYRAIYVGTASEWEDTTEITSFTKFYDIKIDSFNESGVEVAYYSQYNFFERLEVTYTTDNDDDGGDGFYTKGIAYIDWLTDSTRENYNTFRDCIAKNNGGHNFKQGGSDTLISCWSIESDYNNIVPSKGHGFSLNGQAGKEVWWCKTESTSGNIGYEIEADSMTLINCVCDGHSRNIEITIDDGDAPNYTRSYSPDNILIDGMIAIGDAGGGDDILRALDTTEFIIQDFVFEDAQDYGIFFAENVTNCTIQRGSITNSVDNPIHVQDNCNNINFNHLIVYSNPGGAIEITSSGVSNIELHNISSYDNGTTDYTSSASANQDMSNCIYRGTTGYDLTTCYDYDNGDPYVNAAAGNFNLSTDTLGTDLGYTYDFNGNEIQGLPSIGAIDSNATAPVTPIENDTVTCNDDVYVVRGNPTTNYSSDAYFIVKDWDQVTPSDTAFHRIGVMKFDISGMSKTYNNIQLGLYIYDGSGDLANWGLYESTDTLWTEETMVWDSLETIGSLIQEQSVGGTNNEVYVYWNVTNYVNAAYNSGAHQVSFYIQSDDTDFIRAHTKENSSPPIITLSDDTPTWVFDWTILNWTIIRE
jgi:hypothetical protein